MPARARKLRNLYLTGFMGTGKTVVGRLSAERLGLAFIDADEAIESTAGKTIDQIFADQGESYFRLLEREFATHGHPAEGVLVACGGGLVTQPGLLDLLRPKGLIICLFASVETILARTASDGDRPLLKVADRGARVRELLEERAPMYRRAGESVRTDHLTIYEVADRVCRIYRQSLGIPEGNKP